jgi:hypothetical protein
MASTRNLAADNFHGIGMDPMVGDVGVALSNLEKLQMGGLEEL